jgi:HAE1 family hydrophobic/amphiphilic exporter-1
MLPLAMTTGEGEQLWGPMGKTALGGLLLSSVVTLVLVPTMYVILARWQDRFKKRYSSKTTNVEQKFIEVEEGSTIEDAS